MKTPNQIVNEIQAAIAEETTKGIYSDSMLRVTDILRQAQEEAYAEGQRAMRDAAKGYVLECGEAIYKSDLTGIGAKKSACLARVGVLVGQLPILPLTESPTHAQ